MIDGEGFRLNVGIVLINQRGKVFWGKRVGMNAWQFPQGGIKEGETPEQALYRELTEEIGLSEKDVQLIGMTQEWLKYRLPKRFIRTYSLPLCLGQKQKWFLLKFLADDTKICLNYAEKPEFDAWRWVDYWRPVMEVVSFKKEVYRKMLNEFSNLLEFKK